MISFEEAKIIAQKEHNGAYFLNSYTEYKDFWTFGFKEKNGNPAFVMPGRVWKSSGKVEPWDQILHRKEHQTRLTNSITL